MTLVAGGCRAPRARRGTRAARWLAPLLLAGCLGAACTGGGGASPTPAPATVVPSPAPGGGSSPSPAGSPAAVRPPAVGPPGSPVPAAASAAPAASPAPSPSSAGGWTTYHGDLARTGRADVPLDPSKVAARWNSPTLDGDVYAEPLAAGGRVFVATENDTVYALDGASGRVVWSTHLGAPVPGSALPCGNIDPVGITSTPAIDPSAGLLYAVAFVQPGRHELVALDLASGRVRFRQTVDPPGADPRVQLNRAALSLSRGNVYVPYGGRLGDCGAYHGWVVAARASDGVRAAAYQVPTQREGAIWATSGATIASDGTLYAATGNGSSGTTFDFGNAVVKLSPDLRLLDWFAPSNWADLNRRDTDLGSDGPTLVGPNLLFEIGKSGVGYLVDTQHMGHVGGEVFQAPVCSGAYGSNAWMPPLVFVPCRDGLTAVRVESGNRFAVAWRGPGGAAYPPIVVGSSVWSIRPSDGVVEALSAQDGSSLFRSAPGGPAGGLPHFITPGFDGRSVLAARGRVVSAFGGS